MENVLSAGSLSMATIELIKWIVRKVTKNPNFVFEPTFYAVAIPLLNAVMPFVIVYVFGLPSTDPVLAMNLEGVLRYLLVVGVGSIISLGGYELAIKPMKGYAEERKIAKE